MGDDDATLDASADVQPPPTDQTEATRIRPTPHGRTVEAHRPTSPDPAVPPSQSDGQAQGIGNAQPKSGGGLVRIEAVQPSELVAAAGNAVVTAARLGRLLTRTSWRIARQLPGGQTVENRVQQAGAIAAKALDIPQVRPRPRPRPGPAPTGEEERAARLIQSARSDGDPLREAMQELLQRSVESNRGNSREYLFGTIISQLVPDEARILAALSDGAPRAAADIVVRKRRQPPMTVLANASTIGRAAGVTTPDNVPTYLTRLSSFGLVEFGAEEEDLATQYEILAADDLVRTARQRVSSGRRNPSRIVRKSVRLSPLGREFWAATDPSRPALTQG